MLYKFLDCIILKLEIIYCILLKEKKHFSFTLPGSLAGLIIKLA